MPHIDGLRALAVIPVVLYHLSSKLCPGGFVGVDVFFVISGYLITGGIASDIRGGRFSLIEFYTRRAKRIMPAYFAVIAVVLILAALKFPLQNFQSVSTTAIFSVLYSTNIYFAQVINYFDLDAKNNPLLHLWSLGVEEQFYFVVPLLFLFVWRVFPRAVLPVLISIFALSLAGSEMAVVLGHQQFAFFMLPTRAWELLAGAIIALMPAYGWIKAPYLRSLAWLGLLLLVFCYFFYSEATPFPGVNALPCVIGAVLLIQFSGATLVGNALASTGLVTIGKVSYSLYLWHWPVFVFLNADTSPLRAIVALAVTAVATAVSWRYIEEPIRRNRGFGPRQAFTFVATVSGALLALCLFINNITPKNGRLLFNLHGVNTWAVREAARDERRSHCAIEDLESREGGYLIPIGNLRAEPTFVLWGDSHALALLPGVDLVASEMGKGGLFINLKQNFTLKTSLGITPFHPREDREPVLNWLGKHAEIKNVILVNRWFTQIENQADLEEAVNICRRLSKEGKSVVVLTNVPEANNSALRLLSWGLPANSRDLTMSRENYRRKAHYQNLLMKRLGDEKLAVVIDADQAFQDGDRYITATERQSYYADDNHLNEIGAEKVMQFAKDKVWSN